MQLIYSRSHSVDLEVMRPVGNHLVGVVALSSYQFFDTVGSARFGSRKGIQHA